MGLLTPLDVNLNFQQLKERKENYWNHQQLFFLIFYFVIVY